MTFQIERQDNKIFYCKECENINFINFRMKSSSPQRFKKFQVLMVLITCASCGKESMIYHNKIKRIILIDENKLELKIER